MIKDKKYENQPLLVRLNSQKADENSRSLEIRKPFTERFFIDCLNCYSWQLADKLLDLYPDYVENLNEKTLSI